MNPLLTVNEINNVISSQSDIIILLRIGDITDPLTVSFDDKIKNISFKVSRFVNIYSCEKDDIPEIVYGFDIQSPACLILFYNCNLLKFKFNGISQDQINFLLDEDELVNLLLKSYEVARKGRNMIVFE